MYNRRRRACPICGKPNLLWPSHHLRQVHGLSSEERQRWLPRVSHHPPTPTQSQSLILPPKDVPLSQLPIIIPPEDVPLQQFPVIHSSPVTTSDTFHSPRPCVDTQPHPEFAFQHPCSMVVVGPSQCGKTHFVHQLLTHKCIVYPNKKPWRVVWCYNQWQPRYEEIRRDLKNKIEFVEGVPELSEDLHEINPSKHTIIVLDDLMAEAKDSPVVSKLFTQGRHRNASVILLLQNMFPKGKYNTDISRNATYKVLFRSPGDRKQIDIMAEQTFAKDRPRFMQAYKQETDHPYGYIVVDNHPRTTSEHQVVANVFGDCYTYPHITSTSPPSQSRVTSVPLQTLPLKESPLPEQPVTVTRKRPFITIEKRKAVPTKKRKVQKKSSKRKPIKKRNLQTKSEKKPRKSKKTPRKQPVYDSLDEDMIIGPMTARDLKEDSVSEEGEDEETNSEEEADVVDHEEEEINEESDPDDIENMTLEEAFFRRPKIPMKYRRGIGVGTRRY